MNPPKMSLSEATRRFETQLEARGWEIAMGVWREHVPTHYSHTLYRGDLEPLPDTLRAHLWSDHHGWIGAICFEVEGDDHHGIFPLTLGRLSRSSRSWRPKDLPLLRSHLTKVGRELRLWHSTHPDHFLFTDALVEWAQWLLRQKYYKRAYSVLSAMRRGDFDASTIAEALALAQHKWASQPFEQLTLANIWWRHFGPR